jgi:hypothetical protein
MKQQPWFSFPCICFALLLAFAVFPLSAHAQNIAVHSAHAGPLWIVLLILPLTNV